MRRRDEIIRQDIGRESWAGEWKAYSAGGLAFEACLGGGEAGGSNGVEHGRLHDVFDLLFGCLVRLRMELIGLYRVLGVLIGRHSY